jgi:hypothetical protein
LRLPLNRTTLKGPNDTTLSSTQPVFFFYLQIKTGVA